MVQIAKAVAWKCSVKMVFLKISQTSQENTFARVSFFMKLQASGLRCFTVNFVKSLRTPFLYRTPPGDTSQIGMNFVNRVMKLLLL